MKNLFKIFPISVRLLFFDKAILFLSLMPVTIGIALYYFLGHYLFVQGKKALIDYLQAYISLPDWGTFLQTGLTAILAIIFYFIVSWTFVLIVSIIASPFHDMISEKVENRLLGTTKKQQKKSFWISIISILKNETKKILFIIFLSSSVFLLGLFPLLAPLSFIITALLIAIQFLDYNWSRHNYPLAKCRKEIFSHLISYTIHGAGFLFLITIPILNLFILPFGVIYFSVLWTLNKEKKIENYR